MTVEAPLRADAPSRARFPTGLTVMRALAVARWVTWLWMFGVVLVSGTRSVDVTRADDPSGPDTALRHPVLASICVGAVLVMAIVGTVSIRSAPDRLMRPAFALTEGALALALSALDGYVFDPGHVFETSQSLATQYPLIAAASLGLTFGPALATTFGVLVGPAEWAAVELNEFDGYTLRHWFSLLATSIFFGAAGAVFGWLATLLRRVEGEIADQRARDEVGRVLHDTVLQTLALVEQRTASSDPELAGAARRADRELRRFLFGASTRSRHTLEALVRERVEGATAHHDIDVTVNVVDDGCTASPDAQRALAGAVGEAVTNAIKHAAAHRIVVFVETLDDGSAFASVRDDGRGFDTDSTTEGPGLRGSIRGRMGDAGGRAEVVSEPGAGTEIRLWTT